MVFPVFRRSELLRAPSSYRNGVIIAPHRGTPSHLHPQSRWGETKYVPHSPRSPSLARLLLAGKQNNPRVIWLKRNEVLRPHRKDRRRTIMSDASPWATLSAQVSEICFIGRRAGDGGRTRNESQCAFWMNATSQVCPCWRRVAHSLCSPHILSQLALTSLFLFLSS